MNADDVLNGMELKAGEQVKTVAGAYGQDFYERYAEYTNPQDDTGRTDITH